MIEIYFEQLFGSYTESLNHGWMVPWIIESLYESWLYYSILIDFTFGHGVNDRIPPLIMYDWILPWIIKTTMHPFNTY